MVMHKVWPTQKYARKRLKHGTDKLKLNCCSVVSVTADIRH